AAGWPPNPAALCGRHRTARRALSAAAQLPAVRHGAAAPVETGVGGGRCGGAQSDGALAAAECEGRILSARHARQSKASQPSSEVTATACGTCFADQVQIESRVLRCGGVAVRRFAVIAMFSMPLLPTALPHLRTSAPVLSSAPATMRSLTIGAWR